MGGFFARSSNPFTTHRRIVFIFYLKQVVVKLAIDIVYFDADFFIRGVWCLCCFTQGLNVIIEVVKAEIDLLLRCAAVAKVAHA